MEVNKKRLSEIFGVSVRTIQNWQEQGMPVVRGGGKGNEVLFESAAAIEWYSARDAAIENEKLRKEVEDLRIASESDLQPGTIEYERHRLTRAQADAQELKNAKESAEVVETAFCTFVLSRVANRPALKKLLRTLNAGDTLVVWKLDRIGRNVLHALLMFQQLQEKGINFRSITDGVDLKTASGRYNFRNILSAAQYESDLNSERTLAGLAVARAKWRVGGRRPKFTDEQWREMGERMATGESRQSVSKTYGVGLSTLYKKFPAS